MLRPIVYSAMWSPPSCAVRTTAKAIGLELNIREMNLLKGEHLTEDYRKINPQQTVPTLDDNGFILCDSHAIMTYLVGKYSKNDNLYPKDLNKRAMIDQKLHFNNGILSVRIREAMKSMIKNKKSNLSPESTEMIYKVCGVLNEFLSEKTWLVGETYTLADISCGTHINYLKIFLSIDKYPNVNSWIKNCEEQVPGFEEIITPGKKLLQGIFKLPT